MSSWARQALESGAGLAKLKSFISRQGGDADVTEDYSIFPQSSLTKEILADEGGFVQSVDARPSASRLSTPARDGRPKRTRWICPLASWYIKR